MEYSSTFLSCPMFCHDIEFYCALGIDYKRGNMLHGHTLPRCAEYRSQTQHKCSTR
jgi:hypothetical protein